MRQPRARTRRILEALEPIALIPLEPPENVLVLSLDEKTGIQAKAPLKPDRAPAPGKPARREHEYKRNGTQCLFAALKVHHGEVASKTRNRWDLILIQFLDQLDAALPIVEGHKIVAVSDNLSTRGTQEVQEWLAEHPRWSFQFTPTRASCLNQTMAARVGVSPATVQRIWSARGLQPHRSRRSSSQTTRGSRRSSSMSSACI